MGCWRGGGRRRWFRDGRHGNAPRGGPFTGWRSSGNTAFDAYREETLRRLEQEQEAFTAFLEQLRQARDKAEFDRFMAERGTRGAAPEPPSGETPPDGAPSRDA